MGQFLLHPRESFYLFGDIQFGEYNSAMRMSALAEKCDLRGFWLECRPPTDTCAGLVTSSGAVSTPSLTHPSLRRLALLSSSPLWAIHLFESKSAFSQLPDGLDEHSF